MTLVLGLQERERQKRAGLALGCVHEPTLDFGKKVPRKSQSWSDYIPVVVMDTQ